MQLPVWSTCRLTHVCRLVLRSVYHQFSSVCPPDPAFVAISVHTDETGGDLDPETLAKVESGDHSIGLLTMLAPQAARDLADDPAHLKNVPLTVLSFDML